MAFWNTKAWSDLPDRQKAEIFASERCERAPDGCLIFTGKTQKESGHVQLNFGGRRIYIHRFFYETYKGSIPDGWVVCHSCDNPRCVNIDHLWLGTKGDNNRDMFSKNRNVYNPAHYTKCKQGHEFTPENTGYSKEGHRKCKRCQLIKTRIASGWTPEQAETLPVTPRGYRPVGAQKPVVKTERVQTFSTHGSSPRQRAWRARQKAKRLAQVQL